MGAQPAGPLAVFVTAVAILGSARPAAAQEFPSSNPLAIRMPNDARQADVKTVVEIAMGMGVPLGFEEAGALTHRIGARQAKPIVSVRPLPLDVRGVTLREALDAVIAKDRRYAWGVIEGVVVVRPIVSWRDGTHPLLRTMHEVQLAQPALAEAVGGGPLESTLLERLNATARARPESHWTLTSSSSVVKMDRGRVVEIVEPELRFGGPAGENAFSLGWR